MKRLARTEANGARIFREALSLPTLRELLLFVWPSLFYSARYCVCKGSICLTELSPGVGAEEGGEERQS